MTTFLILTGWLASIFAAYILGLCARPEQYDERDPLSQDRTHP